eukprot:scaffold741_cov336-Pavlova_lutheri.AAC.23
MGAPKDARVPRRARSCSALPVRGSPAPAPESFHVPQNRFPFPLHGSMPRLGGWTLRWGGSIGRVQGGTLGWDPRSNPEETKTQTRILFPTGIPLQNRKPKPKPKPDRGTMVGDGVRDMARSNGDGERIQGKELTLCLGSTVDAEPRLRRVWQAVPDPAGAGEEEANERDRSATRQHRSGQIRVEDPEDLARSQRDGQDDARTGR